MWDSVQTSSGQHHGFGILHHTWPARPMAMAGPASDGWQYPGTEVARLLGGTGPAS